MTNEIFLARSFRHFVIESEIHAQSQNLSLLDFQYQLPYLEYL